MATQSSALRVVRAWIINKKTTSLSPEGGEDVGSIGLCLEQILHLGDLSIQTVRRWAAG